MTLGLASFIERIAGVSTTLDGLPFVDALRTYPYTPDDGRVSVVCYDDGDCVRIVVRDSGRGIPASEFESICESFVQIDRHMLRDDLQGLGLGLGLAISRDLATGMERTLTVDSTVGAGSAFSLSLRWSAGQ